MSLEPIRTGLSRGDRFGFGCGRCGACCSHKRIPLNPYEIARLAARLGITTTRFIDAHTADAGSFLRFDADGKCPFLRDKGCDVHADRPLACRLYPLGRHIEASGAESFLELRAEPECALVARDDRSVGDWLDEQGTAPFIAATDLYLDLLWKVLVAYRAHAPRVPVEPPATDPDQEARDWLDIDAVLARHGATAETDVENRMRMHIHFIEEELDSQESHHEEIT